MKISYGEKHVVWVLLSLVSSIVVVEAQTVECYFIFGDGIVDNGNNNDVAFTDAKANYAPYGVDLPNVPKGRFTNGLTKADIIGQLLGLDLIPPYLTARGNITLKGVNYASYGAGIRDETGIRKGATSLRRQILNHVSTVATITSRLGLRTPTYLNQCLYAVYVGSDDYINNYFKPNEYLTSRIFTPDQYATVLVRQYLVQLQALYLLGARKVSLHGLERIGCIPLLSSGSSCSEAINSASVLFNARLQAQLPDFNRRLPGANFVFITPADTLLGGIPNKGPCCEVASGDELCVPNGNICANRDQYLFWDAVHLTEAANNITATANYAEGLRLLNG